MPCSEPLVPQAPPFLSDKQNGRKDTKGRNGAMNRLNMDQDPSGSHVLLSVEPSMNLDWRIQAHVALHRFGLGSGGGGLAVLPICHAPREPFIWSHFQNSVPCRCPSTFLAFAQANTAKVKGYIPGITQESRKTGCRFRFRRKEVVGAHDIHWIGRTKPPRLVTRFCSTEVKDLLHRSEGLSGIPPSTVASLGGRHPAARRHAVVWLVADMRSAYPFVRPLICSVKFCEIRVVRHSGS